jgi:hypothetical protein
MPNNFRARLDKIETAVAVRADTGRPKLTEPGWPPVLLNSPEYHAAVADGSIKNRQVFSPDEPGPDKIIW